MSDFASPLPSGGVQGAIVPAAPVTVECAFADPATSDRVATRLAEHDCLAVERTTDPETALDRLVAADCVVTDEDLGLELLERIRERDESVPAVLYCDAPVEALLDGALVDDGLIDVVQANEDEESLALLAHRVRTLADHRRTAERATRATVAADAATDGIAVIGPGGSIDFVNAQFARLFGYERDDLAGRPWRALFAEETADRIEADALSAVDDGWQWIGTCEGRRADGGSVTLRTRITDGDDSVVLAVFQQASETLD